MKNVLIIVVILLLVAIGWYFLGSSNQTDVVVEPTPAVVETDERSEETLVTDEAAEDESDNPEPPSVATIGQSVEGRDIVAHRFGSGEVDILLVGGMHGAFSPNTSNLAEQLIEHAEENETFVPSNVRLHIIPTLNPDGLATGESPEGRFNANAVDLNRNFDCEWQPEGVWRSQPVSGGSAAFSEPESAALRDYVNQIDPAAAVVYYAADGGVYASDCRRGVSPQTLDLTNTYADASDYTANESFDFYAITGDAVNWLAGEGVPAISVLLSNYTATEFEQNRAGVAAIMDAFAE